MKLFEFKPKLVSCLKNYSKETFMADLMAGVIVGIVALPLAIAFGIASGVSPEKGIITAIIAGFIISLLGGSKVQIGGPTGAFIVIIYGIIQQYGEAGLIVATLMAGVLLILLGVFKLGAVIKFIPYPIIVGFTSGIAVTIFTTHPQRITSPSKWRAETGWNLTLTAPSTGCWRRETWEGLYFREPDISDLKGGPADRGCRIQTFTQRAVPSFIKGPGVSAANYNQV